MSSKTRTSVVLLTVTAMVIIAVTFYFYVDPEDSHEGKFVPKCMSYMFTEMVFGTGIKCPSCGIQRFTHHLLHGEFSTALSYNYFLVLCLPYVLLAVMAEIGYYIKGLHRISCKAMTYIYHYITLYIYLVLYVVWGVVRNIWNL